MVRCQLMNFTLQNTMYIFITYLCFKLLIVMWLFLLFSINRLHPHFELILTVDLVSGTYLLSMVTILTSFWNFMLTIRVYYYNLFNLYYPFTEYIFLDPNQYSWFIIYMFLTVTIKYCCSS